MLSFPFIYFLSICCRHRPAIDRVSLYIAGHGPQYIVKNIYWPECPPPILYTLFIYCRHCPAIDRVSLYCGLRPAIKKRVYKIGGETEGQFFFVSAKTLPKEYGRRRACLAKQMPTQGRRLRWRVSSPRPPYVSRRTDVARRRERGESVISLAWSTGAVAVVIAGRGKDALNTGKQASDAHETERAEKDEGDTGTRKEERTERGTGDGEEKPRPPAPRKARTRGSASGAQKRTTVTPRTNRRTQPRRRPTEPRATHT